MKGITSNILALMYTSSASRGAARTSQHLKQRWSSLAFVGSGTDIVGRHRPGTIREASSESLDWSNFDYSFSPKQDARFSASLQSIAQTPYDRLPSVAASEASLDAAAHRKLRREQEAWMGLDRDVVKRATEIVLPYVQAKRAERLEEVLEKRTKKVRFLFENPVNPSNVWACLRTLDSFGIQNADIILDSQRYTGKAALAQKRGMRTAMGSAKWLTVRSYPDTQEALFRLKSEGYRVVVSDLTDSVDARRMEWGEGKICVVMGNEETGISDEMRRGADASFSLPMSGFAESFNLSVATAITLAYMASYEKVDLFSPDLSTDEKDCLRLKWLLQSLAKRSVGKALLKRNGLDLPKIIDFL